MNHEITHPVKHNSKSDEEFIVQTTLDTIIKKNDAWDSENDEKDIISFENIRVFGLVMVSVKIPH